METIALTTCIILLIYNIITLKNLIKKPKPILCFGIPNDIDKTTTEIQKICEKKFKDYNIIVHTTKHDDFEFKIFNENDFDKTKYEELKQILKII
jgi:hypothetical protein